MLTAGKSPVQKVLIVEDDFTISASLQKLLLQNGVQDCQLVSDGKEAWQELRGKSYDLLILDWKVPGLSGLGILNRLRRDENLCQLPVMIVSGYLTKRDTRILEDFPLTAIANKPFNAASLIRDIDLLLQQSASFARERDMLDNLAGMDNDPKQAVQVAEKLISRLAGAAVPIAIYCAKRFRHLKHHNEALVLLRACERVKPQSLAVLTEIGKTLLLQRRFREAKQVLTNAQALSPDSVERLCLMGEANLNLMDFDEAKENFDEALIIDKGNRSAKSGQHIATTAKIFMANLPSDEIPTNFASLLNAVGVSHVRAKEFNDGLAHYQHALNCVTDNDIQARLAFNLGLGNLRWKKPREAFAWFEKSLALSNGEFPKARLYVNKLALQLGLPFPPPVGIEKALANNTATAKDLVVFEGDDLVADTATADSAAFHRDQTETILHDMAIKVISPTANNAPKPQETAWAEAVTTTHEDTAVDFDARSFMLKNFPETPDLVRGLEKEGLHVLTNLEKIAKIAQQHGVAVTRDMIKRALKNGTPDANSITFLVETARRVS